VKKERGHVVRRVDALASVGQLSATVAPDAPGRRVVAVVDLKEVRRTVGMILQLEPHERQHQRLAHARTRNRLYPGLPG